MHVDLQLSGCSMACASRDPASIAHPPSHLQLSMSACMLRYMQHAMCIIPIEHGKKWPCLCTAVPCHTLWELKLAAQHLSDAGGNGLWL